MSAKVSQVMRIPEKLLFEGRVVAKLNKFEYEFPWATATAAFIDEQLMNKLKNLSTLRAFTQALEEMDLSDKEEDDRWEKKRAELNLSNDDLDLDNDTQWTVIWNDGSAEEVRALSYEDGWIQWRSS